MVITLFGGQNDTPLTRSCDLRQRRTKGSYKRTKTKVSFLEDTTHHGRVHAVPKKLKFEVGHEVRILEGREGKEKEEEEEGGRRR